MVHNDENWAVKQKPGMVKERTTKLFKEEFLAVNKNQTKKIKNSMLILSGGRWEDISFSQERFTAGKHQVKKHSSI